MTGGTFLIIAFFAWVILSNKIAQASSLFSFSWNLSGGTLTPTYDNGLNTSSSAQTFSNQTSQTTNSNTMNQASTTPSSTSPTLSEIISGQASSGLINLANSGVQG